MMLGLINRNFKHMPAPANPLRLGLRLNKLLVFLYLFPLFTLEVTARTLHYIGYGMYCKFFTDAVVVDFDSMSIVLRVDIRYMWVLSVGFLP